MKPILKQSKEGKKKVVKFKVMYAGRGGWCKWQNPIMKGYKMKCCDCGLVHDMQFKVFEVLKTYKNGSYTVKFLNQDKFRVSMRAKRSINNSSPSRKDEITKK